MKWKFLVAIALILAMTGVLLFTEQGRKYAVGLGSMTKKFATIAGNFIGSFVRVTQKEEFEFTANLNKEAIYGQSFSFSGSNFKASGQVLSFKIDGKLLESSNKTEIEINGNGEISIEKDGKISLKAETNSIKFDSWKTSNAKVEIEMFPENFSLTSAKSSLINITSASGSVKKKLGNVELKAEFSQVNLKIDGFFGKIVLGERAELSGSATAIETDGKEV